MNEWLGNHMKLPCGCEITYEIEDGKMANFIRPHDKECPTFKFMMEQSEVKYDDLRGKVVCKRLTSPHYLNTHIVVAGRIPCALMDCIDPRKVVQ